MRNVEISNNASCRRLQEPVAVERCGCAWRSARRGVVLQVVGHTGWLIVAGLVTGAAAWVSAWRAARMNPTTALRVS